MLTSKDNVDMHQEHEATFSLGSDLSYSTDNCKKKKGPQGGYADSET